MSCIFFHLSRWHYALLFIYDGRKYEEICAPRVEEFCFITDNTYTREEVRPRNLGSFMYQASYFYASSFTWTCWPHPKTELTGYFLHYCKVRHFLRKKIILVAKYKLQDGVNYLIYLKVFIFMGNFVYTWLEFFRIIMEVIDNFLQKHLPQN